MCAWGRKGNYLLISKPLSVSHKKRTSLSLPMNFKMVAHSLLMHLFLLHLAGIQCTVNLSSDDWREAVTWKLKNIPSLLPSSFPISSRSTLSSLIFLTVNPSRDSDRCNAVCFKKPEYHESCVLVPQRNSSATSAEALIPLADVCEQQHSPVVSLFCDEDRCVR